MSQGSQGVVKADVAIVGAGPGGYVAAIRAAQLGLRVILIEKDELGGTCLNKGCIPTKAMLASTHLFSALRRGEEFGISVGEVKADVARMVQRKDRVVSTLVKGVEYLLKSNQVEVIKGTAHLGAVGLVEVKDEEGSLRTVEAEKVILATGSLPALIPGVTVDGQRIMTSDEALNLQELPEEILIVGASVVGVEFATIFNQLGSKVTLVEMLPRIVMTEDDEIADLLAKHLKRNGVDLLVGYRVDKVSPPGNGPIAISVSSRDEVRELKADTVLIAIGRKPNTTGLNLEAVGVETENGFIKVNEQMETNVQGIYAIGDVVGGLLLAHVASAEGIVAAENAAGMESTIDYLAVPSCIFTSPEIAHVGPTEKEARERGHEVKVGKFPFTASGKALAEGEREGLIKVVVDKTYDEILGVHIMGPSASTIIAEAALAMKLEATPKEIYETIHAHPTLNEVLMEAALDVDGLAIHLPRKARS